MENIRYTTKETIESLCKKLKLPKPHEYSQDWEDEVMDSQRIEEFIEYYQKETMNEDEKFTLMVIIINSCDDALSNGSLDMESWKKVKAFLINDRDIHKETIDYWSAEEIEDVEDCFIITPLIREIKKEIINI